MSMICDLERIERAVLPNDPSFRSVDREELDRYIREARQNARANAKDAFLLSLMGLLACPGNGHTRLIPNHAISVLPLRFVTIGSAVRLLHAPPVSAEAVGSELLCINGIPVSEIEARAGKFLAGTKDRKRVIGPILFAWPSALVRLGVFSSSGPIEYRTRDQTGRVRALDLDTAQRVPGSALYPRNEHGKADASWSPGTFLEMTDFGERGLLMVLPSFFDPVGTNLSNAVTEAAASVRSRPHGPCFWMFGAIRAATFFGPCH